MMKKVKFGDPRKGHIVRALKISSGTTKITNVYQIHEKVYCGNCWLRNSSDRTYIDKGVWLITNNTIRVLAYASHRDVPNPYKWNEDTKVLFEETLNQKYNLLPIIKEDLHVDKLSAHIIYNLLRLFQETCCEILDWKVIAKVYGIPLSQVSELIKITKLYFRNFVYTKNGKQFLYTIGRDEFYNEVKHQIPNQGITRLANQLGLNSTEASQTNEMWKTRGVK
jgi:hypothetical protein